MNDAPAIIFVLLQELGHDDSNTIGAIIWGIWNQWNDKL